MIPGSILSKCLNDNSTCKKIFEFLSEEHLHENVIAEINKVLFNVNQIDPTILKTVLEVKKQTISYLTEFKLKDELPDEIFQYHMENLENFAGDFPQSVSFYNQELVNASRHAKICLYINSVHINELELSDIYSRWQMMFPKVLSDWLIKKQNPSEQFKKYMKKKGYNL